MCGAGFWPGWLRDSPVTGAGALCVSCVTPNRPRLQELLEGCGLTRATLGGPGRLGIMGRKGIPGCGEEC